MEHIQFSRAPTTERALLIAAFAGWNDAASAATWAARFLINQWAARPFAEIDPDIFFDFTSSRPQVRVSSGTIRKITWPTNKFYSARIANSGESSPSRDIIVLLGQEPHLRWRVFNREALELAQRCHVEEIVLIGSLVAEVPHTKPIHVTGTSNQSAMLRRFKTHDIGRANYNGSTGILTALHEAAKNEGYHVTSLWGVAPHYVSATPNLPVAEALLRRLDTLYNLNLQLEDLAYLAKTFTSRVSTLVADDPDLLAYVQALEQTDEDAPPIEREISFDASGAHRVPRDGGLPTAEQAVEGAEELLRRYRDGNALD
jgi:proteasome assembly chaperone (PAC2) family protein